jgi:hypothetical protein
MLYLFGRHGVAPVDLAKRTRPTVGEFLRPEKVGELADVGVGGDHLYLLGARGLQVGGRHADWMSDSIQVEADRSFEIKGRYAFLVGERTLEVLDLAPYHVAGAANPE